MWMMGANQPPTPDSTFLKTPPMNQDLQALRAINIFDPRSKEMTQRYPVPTNQAKAILKLLVSPPEKMKKVITCLYQQTAVDDPGICLLGHCLQTIGMLRQEKASAGSGRNYKPLRGMVQTAAQVRKDLESLKKTLKQLQQQIRDCGMDLLAIRYLDAEYGAMRPDPFTELAVRAVNSDGGSPCIKYTAGFHSAASSEQTLNQLLAQVAQQVSDRVKESKATAHLMTGLNRKNAQRIFALRRLYLFWCQAMQLPKSEESFAEIATFILDESGTNAEQSALGVEDVRSALRGWSPIPECNQVRPLEKRATRTS